MKRYQCIKNYYVTLIYESGNETSGLAFKAGKTYPVESLSGFDTIVDEYGDTWDLNWVSNHFHELLDLHVDEHEEDQYTALLPSKKAIGTGCAIVVAAILTVFITLLSLL